MGIASVILLCLFGTSAAALVSMGEPFKQFVPADIADSAHRGPWITTQASKKLSFLYEFLFN